MSKPSSQFLFFFISSAINVTTPIPAYWFLLFYFCLFLYSSIKAFLSGQQSCFVPINCPTFRTVQHSWSHQTPVKLTSQPHWTFVISKNDRSFSPFNPNTFNYLDFQHSSITLYPDWSKIIWKIFY